jgi:hypothetical protein
LALAIRRAAAVLLARLRVAAGSPVLGFAPEHMASGFIAAHRCRRWLIDSPLRIIVHRALRDSGPLRVALAW